MITMKLTIPDERLHGLSVSERDVLVDVAIGCYKRRSVSLGRAAAIAGVGSPEFLNELARRRIPLNYDVDDLRQDAATLNDLPA